jgi:hypothetical protein
MSKTDLQKILSVAGQPGLFRFVAQANAGIIAESLSTQKRSMFGINVRLTSLSDISIYTDTEEVSLIAVFEKMKSELVDEFAPDPKSDPKVLKEFFEKVIPDYDRDRFYVSHMKKVVDWYNHLKRFATLDFEKEEEIKEDN